jgi:hypothetical protein
MISRRGRRILHARYKREPSRWLVVAQAIVAGALWAGILYAMLVLAPVIEQLVINSR